MARMKHEDMVKKLGMECKRQDIDGRTDLFKRDQIRAAQYFAQREEREEKYDNSNLTQLSFRTLPKPRNLSSDNFMSTFIAGVAYSRDYYE